MRISRRRIWGKTGRDRCSGACAVGRQDLFGGPGDVAGHGAPDDQAPGAASRTAGGRSARTASVGTGITEYLRNGGDLEVAARIAGHESTRTTQLYNRVQEEISLDEIERIHI